MSMTEIPDLGGTPYENYMKNTDALASLFESLKDKKLGLTKTQLNKINETLKSKAMGKIKGGVAGGGVNLHPFVQAVVTGKHQEMIPIEIGETIATIALSCIPGAGFVLTGIATVGFAALNMILTKDDDDKDDNKIEKQFKRYVNNQITIRDKEKLQLHLEGLKNVAAMVFEAGWQANTDKRGKVSPDILRLRVDEFRRKLSIFETDVALCMPQFLVADQEGVTYGLPIYAATAAWALTIFHAVGTGGSDCGLTEIECKEWLDKYNTHFQEWQDKIADEFSKSINEIQNNKEYSATAKWNRLNTFVTWFHDYGYKVFLRVTKSVELRNQIENSLYLVNSMPIYTGIPGNNVPDDWIDKLSPFKLSPFQAELEGTPILKKITLTVTGGGDSESPLLANIASIQQEFRATANIKNTLHFAGRIGDRTIENIAPFSKINWICSDDKDFNYTLWHLGLFDSAGKVPVLNVGLSDEFQHQHMSAWWYSLGAWYGPLGAGVVFAARALTSETVKMRAVTYDVPPGKIVGNINTFTKDNAVNSVGMFNATIYDESLGVAFDHYRRALVSTTIEKGGVKYVSEPSTIEIGFFTGLYNSNFVDEQHDFTHVIRKPDKGLFDDERMFFVDPLLGKTICRNPVVTGIHLQIPQKTSKNLKLKLILLVGVKENDKRDSIRIWAGPNGNDFRLYRDKIFSAVSGGDPVEIPMDYFQKRMKEFPEVKLRRERYFTGMGKYRYYFTEPMSVDLPDMPESQDGDVDNFRLYLMRYPDSPGASLSLLGVSQEWEDMPLASVMVVPN